jgi:hypothetical protein
MLELSVSLNVILSILLILNYISDQNPVIIESLEQENEEMLQEIIKLRKVYNERN